MTWLGKLQIGEKNESETGRMSVAGRRRSILTMAAATAVAILLATTTVAVSPSKIDVIIPYSSLSRSISSSRTGCCVAAFSNIVSVTQLSRMRERINSSAKSSSLPLILHTERLRRMDGTSQFFSGYSPFLPKVILNARENKREAESEDDSINRSGIDTSSLPGTTSTSKRKRKNSNTGEAKINGKISESTRKRTARQMDKKPKDSGDGDGDETSTSVNIRSSDDMYIDQEQFDEDAEREVLLNQSIDSFLRGEYDRPFSDDAAAPHPGLGPSDVVDAALRSLRALDDPEPCHGAAVMMRFTAPLSRGERWGGGSTSSPWKGVLR
mmetsp:Transcript_2385/g.3468  ORF Transcript_2385/g.3468 Transcript_2385/m.3468 type:complete len:325 (-) Transcript_2385:856-1830(-)